MPIKLLVLLRKQRRGSSGQFSDQAFNFYLVFPFDNFRFFEHIELHQLDCDRLHMELPKHNNYIEVCPILG